MSAKKLVLVEMLRCPKHGAVCVAIGDERITPSKCCGGWESVLSWRVPAMDIRGAVRRAAPREKEG